MNTAIKNFIKDNLKENHYRKCNFAIKHHDEFYCSLVINPSCGFYGNMRAVEDFPSRTEFWTCKLERY